MTHAVMTHAVMVPRREAAVLPAAPPREAANPAREAAAANPDGVRAALAAATDPHSDGGGEKLPQHS